MERATEGFSSRRSLLVSALTNYRYPPRLISAPTTPPWQRTAQLDARACAARPWGKAGNERRKACFHPGGSGFLLPRVPTCKARLPVLFQQLLCYTQVLCFFLDSRKKRTPFVPLVPLVPAPLAAHPGQLHVQARKDALFQPGDVALRNPQRVGNLLLRHLARASQTKAKLHDLLLAQGQARQRRAQ